MLNIEFSLLMKKQQYQHVTALMLLLYERRVYNKWKAGKKND